MLTHADLAAIAARLDAIPPLPLVRYRHAGRYGIWMDDHGDLRFVASVNDNHGAYLDMFLNAPADLRALLDEVERLRSLLRECQPLAAAEVDRAERGDGSTVSVALRVGKARDLLLRVDAELARGGR